MTDPTRIQLLQVEDCPLVGDVIVDLESCLAALDLNEPVEVLVGDYPSPTLLIDGLDVTTGQPVTGQPQCRLDRPSRDQILAALTQIAADPGDIDE